MTIYVCVDERGNISSTTTDTVTGGVAVPDGVAAHPDRAYVNNGQLVLYTPEQVVAKAQRPSRDVEWDNTAMSWIDPRTLNDRKAAKWSEMKATRDAAEFGTFTWDGSTFDADAQSQSRIIGAALLAVLSAMAQQPFSIDWTLADNTVRTLSGADMIAVGQALGVHSGAQHALGRTLRSAIEAAASTAAVEAVTWPSE